MKKLLFGLLIILALSSQSYCWLFDGVRMPELQNDCPYFAEASGGITGIAGTATFEVHSSSTLDSSAVYVFGKTASTITGEAITLSGTTAVWSKYTYAKIFSIRKSATTGTITAIDEDGTAQATMSASALYCYDAFSLDSDRNYMTEAGNFPSGIKATSAGWDRSEWNRNYYTEPFAMTDGSMVTDYRASDVISAIGISYEVSNDNVNWITGVTALTNLDNNHLRTTIVNPNTRYIRYIVDNSSLMTVEAVPTVEVFYIAK